MSTSWKCNCGELNASNFTYCCQCSAHKSKSEFMSKEQTKYRHQWKVTGKQEALCELCGCKKTKNGKGKVYKTKDGNILYGETPSCIELGNPLSPRDYHHIRKENKELKEQRDELLKEVQMLSRNREKDFAKSFRNKAEVERHLIFVGKSAHKIYLKYSNKKD